MKRLVGIVFLGLAACSSPYSFQKEVADFSSGVDHLSNGFAAGYANLAADRAAQTQLRLADARAKVAIAASCGVAVGPLPQSHLPCELYRFGSSPPAPMAIEATNAATAKLLAGLHDYAHALAAVTNAADRAAFDAAVSQLSQSVGDLATLANAAAPGAGTIAPAGVNLVGWVVGTALDEERFMALKRAVNMAAGPVHSVATALGIGLEAIADARRMVLYEETRDLVAPLGPALRGPAYQERLAQAETTVGTLNALRQTDPADATNSLAKAHDALVAAVNDPKSEYANVLKAVSDFADKAAALKAALSTSSATGSSKGA